jgi:peptide/nickel transport system substrate-binding protein
VQAIRVGNSPTAVAFGDGFVWVTNLDDQSLSKIDAKSGDVVRTQRIDAAGRGVAVGGGAVWVTDSARNRIVRVNEQTGAVEGEINVGSGPAAVAFGAGSVWVANNLDGTVSQIDPATNAIRATIPVGASPNAVAVTAGDVWVADEADAKLTRIDSQRAVVASTVALGSRPGGVAAANGGIWVSGQGATSAHRGGTLRVRTSEPMDAVDPGMAYSPESWPILSITNDGLVAFKRVGGGDGTQIVADLATSVPTPTDDGKTYTFQLRRAIRFSNGRAVTPADVRHSIEREFAFRDSPGPAYFANIVGAAACTSGGRRCDLSQGIVIDDRARTVTFHLTKADPEFLYKLAVPTGAVVPADAPLRASTTPLAGTGPYRLEAPHPKHGVRLVRNPYFHVWSAAAKPAAYPAQIVLTVNRDAEGEVTAVERGRIDVAFSGATGGLPPERLSELTTQYASLVHVTPQPVTVFLQLNTREPPFRNLDARRALAFAIDRGAVVRASAGAGSAQPTCEILPPNFPGYAPYCPFTAGPTSGGAWNAPDLTQARLLARRSGTKGARVTLWSCQCMPTAAAIGIVRRALEQLGYRVSVHSTGDAYAYFTAINDTAKSHVQIAFSAWNADYPAPSNFLDLFACAKTTNGSVSRGSRFCDSAIDRQIERAKRLQASDPKSALALWRHVHEQLVDAAAWVPLYNSRAIDVVSARTQNYQHHPVFGILLDQLWVK